MFWIKKCKYDKMNKYHRQFMLTAAVWMEHNQNTMLWLIMNVPLSDQISWPFLTFLTVAEKNGCSREVILPVRDTL